MIWCRFQKNNLIAYGIVEGDYVTAVDGDPFAEYRPGANRYRLNEVKLLVPVIPPTFYAVGANYRNHVEGRARIKGTAPKYPDAPRIGYRANSALIATNETIIKPHDSGENLEYEGELVAVIGRKTRNVTPQEAMRCIFGWTIGNDVTERDWQDADPTFLRCKNADTFKPMGPWIVTGIEPSAMFTQIRLNGTPVHTFPTGNMLFSPGEVISAISKYNTLSPGDVVWLGTDEVPQNLLPGDFIEIEINGIGVLRNRVAAEAPAGAQHAEA
jgi:2-keto-4-pentenoate hydratase/2-oxohepta-3-ene-1,7-dioic acid hydratase in catechol pathway